MYSGVYQQGSCGGFLNFEMIFKNSKREQLSHLTYVKDDKAGISFKVTLVGLAVTNNEDDGKNQLP